MPKVQVDVAWDMFFVFFQIFNYEVFSETVIYLSKERIIVRL